ncbi:MAG: leucine-rich repeat domain-containing protein, partial [Mycoplasmataceae bacterium]|nr:leucine-rich repeat domain-containing protein [Mycoplasmataceae bacterium]
GSDTSGNNAALITYTFVVTATDIVAPTWNVAKILTGSIPVELGSSYTIAGNKNVIIQLTGTQTSGDVSSIINSIRSNIEITDNIDGSITYKGSFADGISEKSLPVGTNIYTLSGSDAAGNKALKITYTFIINPTSMDTQAKWEAYLDGSLDRFGKKFVEKAKEAIDWKKGPSIKKLGLSRVIVPENFIWPPIITIGDVAFQESTLSPGFTLPSSVTTIGRAAFGQSTLSPGFTLPSSVTTIGDYAFYKIKSPLPSSFVVPSSVTELTPGIFLGITLSSNFVIPSSITKIDSNAFGGTALPSGFTIPHTVITVAGDAFQDAKTPDGKLFDTVVPFWSAVTSSTESIPTELGGAYSTSANKDVTIQLMGVTTTTYDASAIISKILANTKLEDAKDGHIATYTSSFISGTSATVLSIGEHVYTLMGYDAAGNHSTITYTFKIISPDVLAPTWSVQTTPSGSIPDELGEYTIDGNKDVNIKLTGAEETTYDASAIISQILANIKINDDKDNNIKYTGSFVDAIKANILPIGTSVFTLSSTDASGNKAKSITYTFNVIDKAAPVWSIVPHATVPSELGSSYSISGNKDVIIQLTGTHKTHDVSAIINQIKSNTKLDDAKDGSIKYTGSFANGATTTLSAGTYVYTLSGSDKAGNSAMITYTFKIIEASVAKDAAIQKLVNTDIFTDIDGTKLNNHNDFSKATILSKLQAMAGLDILVKGDIDLDTNTDGQLKVTISPTTGSDKVLTFTGFQTVAGIIIIEKDAAIQKLVNTNIFADNDIDKTKLNTHVDFSIATILRKLQAITGLATLVEGNIALNTNTDGKLIITISPTTGKAKVLTFTGFQTTAEAIIIAKDAAIQKLVNDNIFADNDIDGTKLNTHSDFSKTIILGKLQAIAGLATLAESHITLDTNTDGKLIITISPTTGEDKVLTFTGFQTTAEATKAINLQSIKDELDKLTAILITGLDKTKQSTDASQVGVITGVNGVSFTLVPTISDGQISFSITAS